VPSSKPNRKQVSVSIDADLAAWLIAEAGQRRVGVAFLVEAALTDLKAGIPAPAGQRYVAAAPAATDGEA